MYIVLLFVVLWGNITFAFSNTSKPDIVYMRPPNDRGPTTWQSGLKCLQFIGSKFLPGKSERAKLTMIITHSNNLTTPASEIQKLFLIAKNQAVDSEDEFLGSYLMSVVSDAEPLSEQIFQSANIVHTDSYVIIVDSVGQVHTLFKEYISRMQSWNPGARFLILYNHIEDRNRSISVTEEIFDLVFTQFYVNTVSLLYAVNNTGYDYYMLDNFNNTSCRTVMLKKIDTCDMGVFPDYNSWNQNGTIRPFLQNSSLEKCTFNMCAAIAAPFINEDCVSGIEMHLIVFIETELGIKFNFTCQNDTRGVRENGIWTGLLGRLNNESCDFIIGGFFSDNEVREDFWATDSYLSDSYTWFIALAKRRPAWRALFTIYQPSVWLCVGIVFLITWFSWLAFGCILPEKEPHKSTSLTAFNSWGVTLGASVNERPECHTSRIFFIGLCFYSMNVTSIYISQLINVFLDPGYEHQISTIQEVIHDRIPYGGLAENLDWFQSIDMEVFAGYNSSDNFMPRKHNLDAVKMGERVILANKMLMLTMNIDQFFQFPKNVFSGSFEIIVKRGFPFLERFNALIRKFKGSGLFNKIEKDFRHKFTVLNKIRGLQNDIKHETVIALTIHHLENAFGLLIFGILLSCVAFAGEQFNYRYFHPWLCKKFNWKIETETKQQTRKHHRHHHKHYHRFENKGAKKNRQKEVAAAAAAMAVPTKEEMRTIINVRMEQIRFTPMKRRKIRLD